MPYQLDNRLVIGIASSAIFDLTESDAVFQAEGEEAYQKYQDEHLQDPLAPGVAFPFIKRLLALNDLASADDPLVEVIVLSRNSPETGLRVMRSITHHRLAITRAVFRKGQSPHDFMPAFNMSLFLSANDEDVREAIAAGLPAGTVLPSDAVDDGSTDLRIAFDFDGVLADDESEQVMQHDGLTAFRDHEVQNVSVPHTPGPLRGLLVAVNKIQQREAERQQAEPGYPSRVRVAVVTARNAPADERAIRTLRNWGVTVDDAFFLGGIDKTKVLAILKPHIFFDDQETHLRSAAALVPSVHVPFGALNARAADLPDTETAPSS